MTNDIEVWKQCPTVPILEVSNMGRVRSTLTGKIHNQSKKTTEYAQIVLPANENGKRKWLTVHRLVASTFLGESDLHVNHIDNNRLNNSLSNLEYVSIRDNTSHGKLFLKNKSSKYIGVSWSKSHKKWVAMIRLNGKKTYLGHFQTEEEAHKAYLNALEQNGIVSKYA